MMVSPVDYETVPAKNVSADFEVLVSSARSGTGAVPATKPIKSTVVKTAAINFRILELRSRTRARKMKLISLFTRWDGLSGYYSTSTG
jgi:hypothetical protein